MLLNRDMENAMKTSLIAIAALAAILMAATWQIDGMKTEAYDEGYSAGVADTTNDLNAATSATITNLKTKHSDILNADSNRYATLYDAKVQLDQDFALITAELNRLKQGKVDDVQTADSCAYDTGTVVLLNAALSGSYGDSGGRAATDTRNRTADTAHHAAETGDGGAVGRAAGDSRVSTKVLAEPVLASRPNNDGAIATGRQPAG